MDNTKADRTIIVFVSIFVVMKCTPQKGERETNKKYQGKSSIHSAK